MKRVIIYMLISTLAFTVMNSLVKGLSSFSAYQIVFFRSAGTLVFTIPFLIKNKISIYGNRKTLLLLRGVVGLLSMLLFFMSLKHLPIGSAVTLRYTSPIFAAILALFLLKEKVKPVQWIFFALAYLGVILVKGFNTEISSIGLMYIMSSAFFGGLVYILIRKIGNQDHPVVIVNYFMCVAALVGGLLSIKYWSQPKGTEWFVLLSLGVFGYFGQLFMTKAFQVSETNVVAPLKYFEVIFTVFIGVIWFNESYTLYAIIGILLVVLALTGNVFAKRNVT